MLVRSALVVSILAATIAGCATAAGGPMLTGTVTRGEIETSLPAWRDEIAAASVDAEAARALREVPPGAEVEVFLGTWCGDSRRVISRLFVALEEVPDPPFELELIAVDRSKRDPEGRVEGRDIRFVPTIIVTRDGVEVGRIVESAPHGVEVDLLALLRGERTGTLTLRTDL
jgi:hypothetical protein